MGRELFSIPDGKNLGVLPGVGLGHFSSFDSLFDLSLDGRHLLAIPLGRVGRFRNVRRW